VQLAVLWLVLMVGAFYLLLWRPQQRRMAATRMLQSDLHEGDEVLTTSGIYGRIMKLADDAADLEIAPGTVIHIARGAIGQRIGPDYEPGADDARDGDTGAN
jgi:preprotein translocase subunit YajC